MPREETYDPNSLWESSQRLSATLPDDVVVGVGRKEVGGELTDTIALVACVPRKLPLDELPDEAVVPDEWEGVPTDVLEWQPEPLGDSNAYAVMHGGIEIGRPGSVAGGHNTGTLGAIVRSRNDGHRMMLSCEHVMGAAGTAVHQPGGGRVVGSVAQASAEGDCAAADPAAGVNTSRTIEGVGQVRQSRHLDPTQMVPAAGTEAVKKRGARTLLTTGEITLVLPSPLHPRMRELHIRPRFGDPPFVEPGDSGSAVLNNANEVVGLLHSSGPPPGLLSDGTIGNAGGVATVIQDVEAVLDVEVEGTRTPKPRRSSAYFFRGDQCGRWDVPTDFAEPPKKITDHFRHIPAEGNDFTRSLDAVVAWGNGKAYFFKGSQYIRWDMATRLRDVGPAQIATFWPNFWFPQGINTAVNWGDNNVFFFRGAKVGRWTISPDGAAEGPLPIRHFFPGWPDEFSEGATAAVNWGNGKVYFFRGARYFRMDQATKLVDVGPTDIAQFWPGFPFSQGPGTAVNWLLEIP